VLVTGSAGKLGRAIVRRLTEEVHDVVELDLTTGTDIRDRDAVRQAARGCDAIVHAAAIRHDDLGTPDEIFDTNVGGTWNVVGAARAWQVARVVFLSSCHVTGLWSGHRLPDYLPIDESHPGRNLLAYGLSKLLGEEMLRALSETEDVGVVSLRPVLTLDGDDDYTRLAERRATMSEEDDPLWGFGSWVDVRDVAEAVAASLRLTSQTFEPLLLAADETCSSRATDELVAALLPTVPWRPHGHPRSAAPYRALVSCERARALIGWAPRAWPYRRAPQTTRPSS
jgi:nucleoside-diphosphate-sugar epimerase